MVFADVSKYNKWIDQVFRDVIHNKDEKSSTEIDKSSEEEEELNDKWAFDVWIMQMCYIKLYYYFCSEETQVVEQCENSYNECVETWTREFFTNQLVRNIYCKRGFYPYRCVYTVKHFIAEKPNQYNPFDTFVTWLINQHHNFMNLARNLYNTGDSVILIF